MDPSFEDVWRRADEVPGWLKPGQAATALGRGAGAAGRLHRASRSAATRAARPWCSARRCGAAAAGWSPSTRSSRAGSSAASRPAPSSSATCGARTSTDVGRARRRLQHAAAARRGPGRSTCSTSTASTTTGPCRDDLRWTSTCPPGGAVAGPRRFSSIGVTLGHPAARVARRADLPTSGAATRWRCSASRRPTAADRLRILARAAVVAAQRRRSRCCCGCDCDRSPRLLGHDSPYDPY